MELKDKKTRITFHSGILTIGGTVIEIAYESSRIFFDFGTEFRPELNLSDNSVQNLIDHGLIPELENVYDERLGYVNHGKHFDHQAVFISHCHLDHTRMINYLSPEIPMYALKETKVLLESLNVNNDFVLPNPFLKGSTIREIFGCDNHQTINVGEIAVTLHRVDHDAYGACALIIKTPDMNIAYTGDLRLHGFDITDTLEFCDAAQGTDVLMIEGVSISFLDRKNDETSMRSEAAVIQEIVRIVNENKNKQITFNVYPGNVKRIAAIVSASPRAVVLEASFANILKECLNIDSLYYNTSSTVYPSLNKQLEVDYEELLLDQSKYLWQAVKGFDQLKGGGVYIHSDATPLGDFDPAYLPFLELLEQNQIQFNRVACSGHAYQEDLNRIVDLIKPKLLVPIHSLKPELLENRFGARHLPKRGETI